MKTLAAPTAFDALNDALGQLRRFVVALDDEQYAGTPAGPSQIGAHVRHTLDHVETLLRGIETGVVNYDVRQRGTPDETRRGAALRRLDMLQAALRRAAAHAPDRPLRVIALVRPDTPPITAASTVSRELVFVLSHAIHHSAMIAHLARDVGADTPPGFGYAPATLVHLEQARCAPSAS
jgi:uncharacterized damage-inducible protein DinB